MDVVEAGEGGGTQRGAVEINIVNDSEVEEIRELQGTQTASSTAPARLFGQEVDTSIARIVGISQIASSSNNNPQPGNRKIARAGTLAIRAARPTPVRVRVMRRLAADSSNLMQ